MKIISGGQTGVDRAALDAAMDCGLTAGGWCPQGRLAEDGTIPEKYALQELTSGGYSERTRENVIASDGTVIIYFGTLIGGSKQTLIFCQKENKPCTLIDGEQLSIHQAAQNLQQFISEHGIGVLNVAGPRASEEPRAYHFAYWVITSLISTFK